MMRPHRERAQRPRAVAVPAEERILTSSHTTGHHLAQALMAAWMMCVPQLVDAGTVERKGAGPDATAIQAIVDQFRLDLGAVDNGSATGPFASGRREIDWDDVPEALASPARLPADYFNTTSPRGAVFTTSGTGFQVSNLSQPRFSNYKATYADDFTTFSAARLFTAEGSNVLDVTFRVPGTSRPATVSGFGVVFTDVDQAGGAAIEFFDEYGERLPLPLGTGIVPTSDGGLSFLGISFDAGERIVVNGLQHARPGSRVSPRTVAMNGTPESIRTASTAQ